MNQASVKFATLNKRAGSRDRGRASGTSTIEMQSLAENVFFGREPRRFGLIRWSEMCDAVRNALLQIGAEVDPAVTVRSLNAAQRQMVAIARSVSLGTKLFVLDQPTSSLSAHQLQVFVKWAANAGERGPASFL